MPAYSFWPGSITLPSDLSQILRKLQRWTKEDGIEYEVSVFYADDDIVLTPVNRGTKWNVKVRHKVSLRYETLNEYRCQKIVEADNKVILRKQLPLSSIPKVPTVHLITNFHTHPPDTTRDGEARYSFFSTQDMNILLQSTNFCMGLACDTLWMVCKCDKTIGMIGENGQNTLQQISSRFFHGDEPVATLRDEMSRWGMVIYNGRIGNELKRIT
ncbi:hypothetical protein KC717_06360 [Candidatus Dojkabacteria bacterium]|uniref:Uncharacterized protein n=1 Tax=Candidatus Dojkabacteria bacterium TaxID=2099670 RepID=A0A955L9Z4_9BACT|nr:hypothetical protein [Candidatus Dojkabacteria bacterium]